MIIDTLSSHAALERSRCRRAWRLAVAAVLLMASAPGAEAQEAIFLVRHAEKVDESPDALLSPVGHERAARLAAILADAEITAIAATSRERTQQTAEPLADRLGLDMHVVASARQGEETMAWLKGLPATARVLVVGHSDTLPDLLQRLGSPEPVTVAPDDYDDLFIVVSRGADGPSIVRLAF